MQAAVKTHVGLIRQVNEDNADIFYREEENKRYVLAVVADGMGGHSAGDVASQLTIKKLKETFDTVDTTMNAEDWSKWLSNAIEETNQHIFKHALEQQDYQGMGTTVVALLILEHMFIVAHVGDSRLYRFAEGELSVLTDDHSLVQELVNTGQITKEEASVHPQRNVITRALGTEPAVKVDVKALEYIEGEQLLLCSDGLSNMLTEAQLIDVLNQNISVLEKSNQLIQMALDAGGEDNVSLVLIDRVDETGK